MDLLIRASTCHDAEAIGRMAAEFCAYLRTLGDETEFGFGAAKYLRDGFGDDPAFQGLVAETDSEVSGYLLYHFGYDTDLGQRLVWVIDLYVREAVRHRGVASALMKRVAEIGRSHGAQALFWSVYEPNTAARRFYESLGATSVNGLRFMSLAIEG
ncbi:MAG: GNAT family N-acetyltransferase [Chthoniobacter sp.]|uniref:GNAT family N-acetyltransferase n=1 Tax=Chthoniobacter sp. TaxID=2510640 RepID=UPI0032A939EC